MKSIAVVAFVYQVTCMYLYLSMALWLVSISLNHFVRFDLLRSVNLSLLDHLKPVAKQQKSVHLILISILIRADNVFGSIV